jgi:4-diphosphocytidyl-2-C-methyl-D-erythritol kinase
LRKRPDGYHDLASLFQAVGFGDTLTLSLLPPSAAREGNDVDDIDDNGGNDGRDAFTCNMPGVPTDGTNLVVRALELMRRKTREMAISSSTRSSANDDVDDDEDDYDDDYEDRYFRADLYKRVPAQAGLGGGSANAATAMWGANELLGGPATLSQLIEWSGELGSDVTFFLSTGTAYCTGRGEVMTPVDFDPPLSPGTKLSIVKPDLGLSTPSVFRALDYDRLSDVDPEVLLNAFLRGGVVAIDDGHYVNDLESPAFVCLPELKVLKDRLLDVDGFDHVMMSGSGTSIYCIGTPADMDGFMSEFDGRDGVRVYNTEFIQREEGRWFEAPDD